MDLDALAIKVRADIEDLTRMVRELQAAVKDLKIKSDAPPKQIALPPRAPIEQDIFTTSEVEPLHEEVVHEPPHPHHEEVVHESPHHHAAPHKTHRRREHKP